MLLTSEYMVSLFSNNIKVMHLSHLYLVIVTIGSVGLNLYNFNSHVLNAIGLSNKTLLINTCGTFGIILPLMLIGAQFSFVHLVMGLSLGQTILGLISVKVSTRIVNDNCSSIKNKNNSHKIA